MELFCNVSSNRKMPLKVCTRMLCNVILLCYAMPCYVMLCYVLHIFFLAISRTVWEEKKRVRFVKLKKKRIIEDLMTFSHYNMKLIIRRRSR